MKDPGHSSKSAGGRLHLSTQTPLTERSRSELIMQSRYSVETYPKNELIRNSSGNTRLQSSQLAEPPWTDPGVKSGISLRELISTLKKNIKIKRRWAMNCRTISPNPRTRAKSHHHHHDHALKGMGGAAPPAAVASPGKATRLAGKGSAE